MYLTPYTESMITSVTQAGITSSGLSYTFVIPPYYSDSINVCCPIASSESGTFTTASLAITDTINSITCTINKNGGLLSNPAVFTNLTLPLTKTTTITGSSGAGSTYTYNYKQYFVNANINFIPIYENATNTYQVIFGISGVGNFEYNTNTHLTYNV